MTPRRASKSRGTGLFVSLWGIGIPSLVGKNGFVVGMAVSFIFAACLWLVIWPTWIVTNRPRISSVLSRTPLWRGLLALVASSVCLWLIDPDGAFPRVETSLTSELGVLELVLGLMLITVTVRWCKVTKFGLPASWVDE
jgi:hypothetical protein